MSICCKIFSSDQFGTDMALCMWNVSYRNRVNEDMTTYSMFLYILYSINIKLKLFKYLDLVFKFIENVRCIYNYIIDGKNHLFKRIAWSISSQSTPVGDKLKNILNVCIRDHLSCHHKLVPVLLVCKHSTGKVNPGRI